ncbi:hypothetical protein AXG93_625s1090 [Marchantia polymorpha subsp. ruderalis]|uniref:Uncharacterized protein n=1 Tax=Marchantia polymorpha subsp. ruderalis TaxID=1480154 RepID=A0A176VCE3_MARPO|nr:hypothetical protein AXG93_625s1090 [Marchantia polymorpha subsp. ruderalis]
MSSFSSTLSNRNGRNGRKLQKKLDPWSLREEVKRLKDPVDEIHKPLGGPQRIELGLCLGGLVMKEVRDHASRRPENQHLQKYTSENFLKSVKGLLFPTRFPIMGHEWRVMAYYDMASVVSEASARAGSEKALCVLAGTCPIRTSLFRVPFRVSTSNKTFSHLKQF